MSMRIRLWGLMAFSSVILGACGVMGDPIPYVQTESFRKAQAEAEARARQPSPEVQPGKGSDE